MKPLDEFPLEVLENIFGYCEVGSLKQLIMSCNSFYEIIVRSKELHTKLTLIINELDCAINSANYKRLIENNRVFLKLVVFPSRFDGECLKTLVEYIEIFGQNIKEVTFRKENTNPRLLMRTIYKTFELMPNLEKITFEGNGWILRSGSINQPLLPFDFLRELHLKRDGRLVLSLRNIKVYLLISN